MMNIICNLSTFSGTLPDSDMKIIRSDQEIPLWSGHCILSFIIPETVHLTMNNSSYDNVKDNRGELTSTKQLLAKENNTINIIKIINGFIHQGTFDKGLFSKTSKGLIHTICNDLGPLRAKDLIDDLQKIVTNFLQIEGFSIGIGDMIADSETNEKINTLIEKRKGEIEEIMQEIHLNIFEMS